MAIVLPHKSSRKGNQWKNSLYTGKSSIVLLHVLQAVALSWCVTHKAWLGQWRTLHSWSHSQTIIYTWRQDNPSLYTKNGMRIRQNLVPQKEFCSEVSSGVVHMVLGESNFGRSMTDPLLCILCRTKLTFHNQVHASSYSHFAQLPVVSEAS